MLYYVEFFWIVINNVNNGVINIVHRVLFTSFIVLIDLGHIILVFQ